MILHQGPHLTLHPLQMSQILHPKNISTVDTYRHQRAAAGTIAVERKN